MQKTILGKSMMFELFENQLTQRVSTTLNLIKQGKLSWLHSYIQQQQLKYQDKKNKNLLYYAAFYNQPMMFLYLIMRGVPFNHLDAEKRNIFHVCGYIGNLQCTDILLTYLDLLRNMELNKQFRQALTQFNFRKTDYKNGQLIVTVTQAKRQNFERFKKQVKVSLQKYYQTQFQDYVYSLSAQDSTYNRTPIHLVSLNKFHKCYQTLKIMVKAQQRSSFNNFYDMWAEIENSVGTGIDPRTYKNIVKQVSNIMTKLQYEILIKKYQSKFKNQIKKILCIKDKQEYTALHLASYHGHSSIVKFLIEIGADPKQIDHVTKDKKIIEYASNNTVRRQITDLCKASQTGDNSCINLLLNCGQQVNSKQTIFGMTPLIKSIQYSADKKNYDTTNILLYNGAQIDIPDTNGWTSIHKTCQKGDLQLLRILLKNKGSVVKQTNLGYTALHIAAINDKQQIIRQLIKSVANIDLDIRDHQGNTPLHHACKKGAQKSLLVLLDSGADIYAVDMKKWTGLHYATFFQHRKCIKILLKYDADANKLMKMQNCHGKIARQLSNNGLIRSTFTNIWRAAYEGNLDHLRKELEQNQDKDQQSKQLKRTPLMYAILGRQTLIAKYLIDLGVNTYLQDCDNKTAEDYAKEYLKQCNEKKLKKQKIQAQKILKYLSKS